MGVIHTMTKWVARIKENDDYFGEEIYLGVAGGEYGFEVILSNEDDSGLLPEDSVEGAMESLRDTFGHYDTFYWLTEEETE